MNCSFLVNINSLSIKILNVKKKNNYVPICHYYNKNLKITFFDLTLNSWSIFLDTVFLSVVFKFLVTVLHSLKLVTY